MLVQKKAEKNGACLVEFYTEANRIICRAWVPSATITARGANYLCDDPQQGIPYGVDFAAHLQHLGSVAQDIDQALKRNGIWTWLDVLDRTDLVKKAYAEALGIISRDLIALAVKQSKE